MADSRESRSDTQEAARTSTEPSGRQDLFERIYSFRSTYVAILGFILLYVFTIGALEKILQIHFDDLTNRATSITIFNAPIETKIRMQIEQMVLSSPWVKWGGIEASPIVFARDGSWIYVGGHPQVQQPSAASMAEILRDAERLLPARAVVTLRVPHNALLANAILIFYATVLLQVLWLRNRSLAKKEAVLLDLALDERADAETKARTIEGQLEEMRQQLSSVEPTEPEDASEVESLRNERAALEGKLASLTNRERELRNRAAKATELDREIRALEDLLDEASDDLSAKDESITQLEGQLKRASKKAVASESGRGREADVLSRRVSTLYKNLEIDARALDDIVALRDEAMKLKCEEKLKRLNDEAENVAVRRKVGGLPPHLTIFEIGFAGKGRIYYTKGKQHRFRVLNVGAKNSQNAAIEYLRKL